MTIGVLLWALLLFGQTRWSWPLAPRLPQQGRPVNLELLLLHLISYLFQTILAFQVTLLCLSVSRRCKQFMNEREAQLDQQDLLKSRSETEGDDIFWR